MGIELVDEEQRAGRLGKPDDPQTIALFLMGTYLAHARFFASEDFLRGGCMGSTITTSAFRPDNRNFESP